MRLETRKYLFDIGQAADSIAAFCAGKTFELYRVDDRIVWGVIEGDLPSLCSVVETLLKQRER